MAAIARDQLALDEKVVDDAELLAALEEREQLRTEASALRATLDGVDQRARDMIDALDLGVDTAIRVGRFRVSRVMAPGRAVSFETESKERVVIGTVDGVGE